MVDQSQMQDNRGPDEHTQALLAALSDKIGDDQIQVTGDASLEPNGGAMNGNIEDMTANGDMQGWDGAAVECWEGDQWDNSNMMMAEGNYNTNEDQMMGSQVQQPGRRKAERREARG